ncbi:MAG: hypothetical protein ACOC93_00690 [Planctomycetota bacterium]
MMRQQCSSPVANVGFWMTLIVAAGLVTPALAVQPGDATWHIGLADVWGTNEQGESRRLDIYPVFENGQWSHALATARQWNTSIHLVQEGEVKLDGDQFSGDLKILLTPDAWVPEDGQPVEMDVTVEGRLVSGSGDAMNVQGTYKGTVGGEQIEGKLIGGVGETETGWGNSAWHVNLNPVPQADAPGEPMVELGLGVADDKVQWATIGRTYEGPAPRLYKIDPSDLAYDGSVVTGNLELPARAVDAAADPDATANLEMTVWRVQGLIGGKVQVAMEKSGETVGEPLMAYGRGAGHQGAGKRDDSPEPLWKYELDEEPWYVPVDGHTPPKAGEHPRLLFRESDLPALREKAGTPEGQAILKRLRVLLDGDDGQDMPVAFQESTEAYEGKSKNLPVGSYTMSHVVGYGLLYQLTGEQKYADLGRKCMELALEGQRDRDDRYSFRNPGGALRAGPTLGWYAVGYDLCYDGWDEDFRKKVAGEIANYHESEKEDLAALTRGTMIPGSNHYGMQVGGAALALLAIRNDPGVDNERIEDLIADNLTTSIRLLRHGWGDHGFFAEGDGTGSMSSQIAFLPALMAWRNADGKDFITPRPHAQWMDLKWILQTVVEDGRPHFPQHGGYPHNIWSRKGLSGGGYFAEGFASISPDKVPGMLWFYNQFLAEHDAANAAPHDTVSYYPHYTVMSFVNWPVGVEPVNPAEVMPQAVADTVHGFFANRNRWQDADDTVVTLCLNNGPDGYIAVKNDGQIKVMALGNSMLWRTGLGGGQTTYYQAEEDGSSVASIFADGKLHSFAVDFSGTSGAQTTLIGAGDAFAKGAVRLPGNSDAKWNATQVEAGDTRFVVVTIDPQKAPEVSVEGQAVRIGDQTVRFDGEKIVLGR